MVEVGLIRDSVATFDVDLAGLTVFTEAATGAFSCTAALALAAGASRVFAIAKDSPHGSREAAADAVTRLANALDARAALTIVHDHLELGAADIVTNTGFVRPLDAAAVARMRRGAVVPLMWETWELRPTDLDLGACLEHGILVLGTSERDPRLGTIDAVGDLAATLLRDAGARLENAAIVIIGGGMFGSAVARRLVTLGARVAVVSEDPLDAQLEPLRVGSSFEESAADRCFAEADALVVCDHTRERNVVGPGGVLTVARFATRAPLVIAHVSGLIDAESLRAEGHTVVPERIATRPRTMSATLARLGDRPVVELHAAGLRVAQVMAHATHCGSLADARRQALTDPLCQDFSPEQYALAARRLL